MPTHLTPQALEPVLAKGNPGIAVFSATPNGTALVFVHGYKGNSTTTWGDFISLLPIEGELAGTDLYFYGYDSTRLHTQANAGLLLNFLKQLHEMPASLFAPLSRQNIAARPDDFSYSRTLLAAHSLGAVICRRALLDACHSECEWFPKTRLTLYAPAHKGADNPHRLADAISGAFRWIAMFRSALGWAFPSGEELKPGSSVLTNLEKETLEFLKHQPKQHPLKAIRVVFGAEERIVVQEKFGHDPVAQYLAHHDHTSICKPRDTFRDPLQWIVEDLA